MIDPNELERLSKAAEKTEDDIRYYSGGSKYNEPLEQLKDRLVHLYRTSQLVPVQQPSEPYAPAQNCLEVPPNILKSGKMLAAMRKSAQPSGDVVEAVARAIRRAEIGGFSDEEVAQAVVDGSWEHKQPAATAAITAYEALRAKDTRP
ncbi:hypothetical protein Saro_2982 [Novosphingobium aromaticivorans DSM 12444]|uniref:Uncharacterized protein n=1 Tax=Novosphingobium aromaticivorans (strain ATCC 700278 / DSM 12444 / CCUG 56034 / CIP 105152 / NBRC 16084 / F199) TaxID=279238 RepID=Q2G406_NOVAD|nr:hypothetical protein [Novosphingobium aromaticivorans]ABD27417.1 hypothetical protein Saro_2982 [Novosphingobium aromaticivorans DSM 12444]SCY68869.1 hypothetical protein SAMN05660666_02480 [Novosphingobium aromaticivorans]